MGEQGCRENSVRTLKAIIDRGYRGPKKVGGTEILSPEHGCTDQSVSFFEVSPPRPGLVAQRVYAA